MVSDNMYNQAYIDEYNESAYLKILKDPKLLDLFIPNHLVG